MEEAIKTAQTKIWVRSFSSCWLFAIFLTVWMANPWQQRFRIKDKKNLYTSKFRVHQSLGGFFCWRLMPEKIANKKHYILNYIFIMSWLRYLAHRCKWPIFSFYFFAAGFSRYLSVLLQAKRDGWTHLPYICKFTLWSGERTWFFFS